MKQGLISSIVVLGLLSVAERSRDNDRHVARVSAVHLCPGIARQAWSGVLQCHETHELGFVCRAELVSIQGGERC